MATGDENLIEIEAFRAGGKAARGITEAQLDEAVAAYNAESAPAPLVFGHPKSDDPAHGVIATVRREGKRLITALKNISDDAVNGVKAGRFINRSIAFWHPDHSANPTPGKWNIRHLGLLGAASPGIPNMPKLTFSADEDSIEGADPFEPVIFNDQKASDDAQIAVAQAVVDGVIAGIANFIASKPEGSKVADDTKGDTVPKTDFDAAVTERDRLQGIVDAANAKAESDRKTANATFVADRIKEGRILPGHKTLFTELLNRLPVEEVQFDADTKGTLESELKKVLAAASPQIVFEALSPTGETNGGHLSADQITAKARKMVEDGQATSFEAAVERIESKQGA